MKKLLPFKKSSLVSLGVELELQIINPHSYGLVSRAKDLIRNIKQSQFQKRIKPEITQSMIELNTSIHHSPQTMLDELLDLKHFLLEQGRELNIFFCGGGTHPFQKWSMQKIFPTTRFKKISRRDRYLSKRSTVFGLHIHIGCTSGEDALYLTHALARYIPQLITMSASSPFYQGIDTGFYSARLTIFNVFPLTGFIPFILNWKEFSNYFYKMRELAIINTMKDVYWDVRPKPEFGTVEVRICDMPLTINKVVAIATYLQTLSYYLLKEKPLLITQEMYYLYNYNRFHACRYGYDGDFINPVSLQHGLLFDDILSTMKILEQYTELLNNKKFISMLRDDVINKKNDAIVLRQLLKQAPSLVQLVNEQCKIWIKNEV